MKFTVSLLAGLLALVGQVEAKSNADVAMEIAVANIQAAAFADLQINNVINWKVGEFQEYNIEAFGGVMGNMKKFVASEQGNAIWVKQEITGQMGNQNAEILIDRANGKILEMRQNGKKVDVPNDPIELISQDSTTITVPAGTFEVIHVVAKSKQAKKIEVWANPRDITMDGGAQMYIESGFLPLTLKLVKFGGK